MYEETQLRRPTRFALGVGISNSCPCRRILWTARTLHKTFEAISLASNPSLSNVLIEICCAASGCDAMIAADTKVLTLAVLMEDRLARIGSDVSVMGALRSNHCDTPTSASKDQTLIQAKPEVDLHSWLRLPRAVTLEDSDLIIRTSSLTSRPISNERRGGLVSSLVSMLY